MLKPSLAKLKFGDSVFSSLGTMQIRIRTRITRSWRSKCISCPQTFRYYSVSMSWTMRNSCRIMFKTSYRKHNIVGQCPSLVSTDNSSSHGIRNQSYSPSRKLSSCIVISRILHLGNGTKLWIVHDGIKLKNPLGNCWKRSTKYVKLAKRLALLHNAFESRYRNLILFSTF